MVMKWSAVNCLYLIFLEVLLRTVKEKEKQKHADRKTQQEQNNKRKTRTQQLGKRRSTAKIKKKNADSGEK
jgi:hypothetical protein